LRVEWFNADAGCGLEVRWQGPNFTHQRLPATALYSNPSSASPRRAARR
jgi:hypothetical protein